MACALIACVAGCDRRDDARAGKALIARFGCGACHAIPGISGADGVVGPPLEAWSRRAYIAGKVPNEPDMLLRWLLDPSSIAPDTAMPDLGMSDAQAREVAAYLYQLR